jgi:hypothetical protein
MNQRTLIRMGGLACIIGGLCIVAFVLIHPWDQLLGAEIARTPRWRAAHSFHFVGGTFALLGLVAIYARQYSQLGKIGAVGFILSFMGNGMFVGTGMITAFIWPMLAFDAPFCVELGGPILASPISVVAFELTAIFLIVGYLIFGFVMLRAAVFPWWIVIMLVLGAILGMLPPHPVGALPWAGVVLGGVLYGAALVCLGWMLWVEERPETWTEPQAQTS